MIGIYRKPGKIERKGFWKDLLRDSDRNDMTILLYFNSHYIAWNCEDIDKNGKNIMEKMEEKEMYIVNWNIKSRIGEGGRKDFNIDLIFCSENIYDEIKCNQIEDTWGSDHFPIEIEIGINKRIYKKRNNRINGAKTNWKEYKKIMIEKKEELDKEIYKNKNEEEKYDYLNKERCNT